MQIWEQIQNMAWDVCFVIALVLLLRPLVGRVSRSMCYGMWILVAIRLMCPVMLSSPVSMFNYITSYDVVKSRIQGFVEAESAADRTAWAEGVHAAGRTLSVADMLASGDILTAGNVPSSGGAPTEGSTLASGAAIPAEDIPAAGMQPEDVSKTGALTAQSSTSAMEEHERISRITEIVWLSGMGLMLAYGIGSYGAMKRRLRFATRLRDNIYENESFESPFVFGVLRPRIYLPYGLNKKQQDYIIRHEAFHVKRRDHLVKMLAFGLLSVYWFHPLVWVSYYVMARDMEMSCDAHVLRTMDGDGKRFYSSLLLRFATDRRLRLPEPLAFGEHSAVSRVRHILKDKKPRLWMVTLALILVAAVVIFCLTDANEMSNNPLLGENHAGTSEANGMSRTEFAEKLWESRNPYIGDASKDGALLGLLLDYYGVEQWTNTELQTSREPYGITLHFAGEPEEAAMQNTAALFLALTENCGEFRWDHTDSTGELVSYCVRTEDVNERYQVEQIKNYAKSSGTVDELLGLLQEQDGSGDNAAGAAEGQTAEMLDESRVISEQSFDMELNQWGEVQFISYAPQGNESFEDVSFVLGKDGKVVYRFPYYYKNNNTAGAAGPFDSVEAVGFRDVNRDGLQDVIVIINYMTEAGTREMTPRSAVRIYLADEEGFHIAEDLMEYIGNHIEEKDMNIPTIYQYTQRVDESRVISEQSFDVELNQWGEVRFVSYAPQNPENSEDVSFLLEKDGVIVYQFPYSRENNSVGGDIGSFRSVEAVGFRDVNQDGLQDVIVIMNYAAGTHDQGGASVTSVARIFVADEKGFHADPDLEENVAEHFGKDTLAIEAICSYLEVQRTGSGRQAPLEGELN